MLLAERPCLIDFPLGGDYLEWINELGEVLWGDIEELFAPLLDLDCERLIYSPPTAKGWHRLTEGDSGEWERVSPNGLPACMVVDVDPCELKGCDQQCVGLAEDGWYVWQGTGLIPIPHGTLLIGHNASAHDSQFFTSEYEQPSQNKTAYIDTRSLVEQVRGLHPDQYAQFEKFEQAKARGKGVPDWVTKATRSNLEDSVRSLLGIEINKSVQGDILNGLEAPKTVFEYCCQDVWATLKLFQYLYPLCRQVFMPSAITWWGNLSVTGLRYPVGSWPIFTDFLRAAYDLALSIKKSERTKKEQIFIDWGRSHLSNFENAVHHNGVMALRFQPGDIFGNCVSEVWSHWLSDSYGISEPGMPDELLAMLSEHGIVSGRQTIGFDLPEAQKLTPAHAQIMASQSILKTKILGRRCPESLRGEMLKADWINRSGSPDIFCAFVTIMDAFIQEYELDAWLSVPGYKRCFYSIKGEGLEQLKACGAEAFRIVEAIK